MTSHSIPYFEQFTGDDLKVVQEAVEKLPYFTEFQNFLNNDDPIFVKELSLDEINLKVITDTN